MFCESRGEIGWGCSSEKILEKKKVSYSREGACARGGGCEGKWWSCPLVDGREGAEGSQSREFGAAALHSAGVTRVLPASVVRPEASRGAGPGGRNPCPERLWDTWGVMLGALRGNGQGAFSTEAGGRTLHGLLEKWEGALVNLKRSGEGCCFLKGEVCETHCICTHMAMIE